MQSSTLYQVKDSRVILLMESFDCRRVPISDIPYEDETKCAKWLQEMFQEKVNAKSSFDKV